MKRRRFIFWGIVLGLFLLVSQLLFPGRQSLIALTLVTALGLESLQADIDRMEDQAIKKQAFSQDDKAFLYALYKTLANGAKLNGSARQTGLMMDRYLSRSGKDLKVESEIFTTNQTVYNRMQLLKEEIRADKSGRKKFESESFYMPHTSSTDSIYGLYWGKIIAVPKYKGNTSVSIHWRAEVPWIWPSYESLKKKYGKYHAENFPIPNLKSVLVGEEPSLFIDNGLGEYLTQLGIAKSFTVYSTWTEEI